MAGYIYIIAFLIASSLITLLPLPRGKASSFLSARLIIPVVLVISAGFFIGVILNVIGLSAYISHLVDALKNLQFQAPSVLEPLLQGLIHMLEVASGPFSLPTTLAITLLFLWAYLLIRSGFFLLFAILILIRWLFRFLKRIVYRLLSRPRPKILKPFPLALPGHVSFLKPTLTSALLLLSIVFSALPYAVDRPPLEAFLAALFWAGIWVTLLEIRKWLHTRKEKDAGRVTGEDASATQANPLEELYYEYQRRHPEQILLAWDEPSRQAPSMPDEYKEFPDAEEKAAELHFKSVCSPAHADRLMHAFRHFTQGGDLLFTDTLSGLHYLLISEIIRVSMGRGEAVFIMCPDGAEEELLKALGRTFSYTFFHYVLRIGVLGKDSMGGDYKPDVLICPESQFGPFLDGPHLNNLVRKCRLFVGLGLERMGISALRYQMIRFRFAFSGFQPQFLLHSEVPGDAEPAVRELVPARNLMEDRLNPETAGERFLLVWDVRGNSEQDFRRFYLKGYEAYVDLPLLLCWLPWERDFVVTYSDPDHRLDRDLFERLQNHVTVHFSGRRARHEEWMQLEMTTFGCSDPDDAVVVTEDISNLAMAVHRNYHFDSKGAVLVCVASHNYLLRDFIAECFHAQKERSIYRLPDDLLQPRVPRLWGGLADLARSLRSALSSGMGLTTAQVQEFLDTFPLKDLLEELKIDVSIGGIERLIEEALHDTGKVVLQRDQGVVRYRYTSSTKYEPEVLYVKNSQGQIMDCVPAGDVGVCVAEDVITILEHKFHQVTQLLPESGTIGVDHQDDDHCKRFRYFFDNTYRIEELRWQEGERLAETRGSITFEIDHWHAHYTRITKGFLEVSETMRPLDPQGSESSRHLVLRTFHSPLKCSRRWRNVLKIRIISDKITGEKGKDGALAFTFCALFQDTIYSLFPKAARRVAVVSPQSAVFPGEGTGQGNPTEKMLAWMYPKIELERSGAKEEETEGLILYLIEDDEEDIGVVRTVKEDYEEILEVIYEYLQWAADQEKDCLYHSFGGGALPPAFDYRAVRELLGGCFPGADRTSTAKRPPIKVPEPPETGIAQGKVCDFCARLMPGPYRSYEDGRQICKQCSESAIKNLEEFRRLFKKVLRQMERRYRITLPYDFDTRFASPEEIAGYLGETFTPTDDFDPRAVGLAIRDERTILVENDAPRIATRATLAHELTHIWQFTKKGSDRTAREILEGQARYIEIDFIRAHGGERLAERLEQLAQTGTDVYAVGWRKVTGACQYAPESVFRCFEAMIKEW